MKIKCFDVLTAVTDEKTKQLGIPENEDKKSELRKACNIIDSLSKRFYGIGYDVDVMDNTNDIIVSLSCGEFQIGNKEDEFYKLVELTRFFSINHENEDVIRIDFVFSGLWDRKESEVK